ncbi:MAG: hypothetical protein H7326_03810 [Bdellovibrionaceae bacterium]|nr:hypothetical protein [Pseudobdellovibrionaceae bacterium]
MSFAEGNFDFESLNAPAPLPLPQNCRQFSDATCFGRKPGSICQVNYPPGRTGICRASGFPEKNGDVSCSCN